MCFSLDLSYTYGSCTFKICDSQVPSALSDLTLPIHSVQQAYVTPQFLAPHYYTARPMNIYSLCQNRGATSCRKLPLKAQSTSMWHDLPVTTKLYPEDHHPTSKHTSVCKTQNLPYRRHLLNIYFQACVPTSRLKSKYSYKIQIWAGGGSMCL